MQVADPLGFFFTEPSSEKKSAAPAAVELLRPGCPPDEVTSRSRSRRRLPSRSRDRSTPRSKGRSASSGSEAGPPGDARLRKLRQRIDRYIERNNLDHRVSGIMQNMHPSDVVKVMETPFPEECRNPSGFVVAQIRRTERDVGRPKDYRWNGKNWDEGPRDFGFRSPPGGSGYGGRLRDRDRGSLGGDHSRGCRRGGGRHRLRRSSRRRRRRPVRSEDSRRSGSRNTGDRSRSSESGSATDSRGPVRCRRK